MYSLRKSFTQLKQRHGTALRKCTNNIWIHITWSQYAYRLEQIAYSLLTIGVQKGDPIAIFSKPHPKWCFTDSAILSIGAVCVPIYNNISNADLIHIINESSIKILFCENIKHIKQWKQIKDQCPCVKKIICYEECWDKEVHPLRWDLFLTMGDDLKRQHPALLQQICENLEDTDLATIVFTSGTTGTPKGIPINHKQIDKEVQAVFPALNITNKDLSLSILPYAHIFGRLESWGNICIGYTIAFSANRENLQKSLREINPSIIITVPEILGKLLTNMQTRISSNPIKKHFFQHAQKLLSQIEHRKQSFKSIKITDIFLQKTSQRYIFTEANRVFGKKLRFIVSGGAPLDTDIAQLFLSSGILVLEGYGLTETTGAISLNTPSSFQFGTVGKPLPGTQIRIADDGEILVKSDTIITKNWFYTGDIGHFNNKGFLVISDRKKDLIKTSSGKYIAPTKLTKKLLRHSAFSYVHIHGDKRSHIIALITLNKIELIKWADQNDLSYANIGDLTQHSQVKEMVRSLIAKTNKNLSNHETIKNFAVLRHEFSIETGELTPSFKVRRKFCDEKFISIIENLYSLDNQLETI